MNILVLFLKVIQFKKIIYLLFPLFLTYPIFGQYAPFDTVPVHTIGAGLASEGIALRDPLLNLSSNPAFLAGTSSPILDTGVMLPFQGTQSAALKPSHFGGYYPLDSVSGLGVRGRNLFHSSFPSESKSTYFQTQVFYSRQFKDIFYYSLGVGPGVGFRGGEQSNLSLSPFVSLGLKYEKFTAGFSAQNPGGVFRYKSYRSADVLEERLPPTIGLGMSYDLTGNLQLYSELRRILYEKSSFTLNGDESKPKFDRGVGGEVKLSLGLSMAIREDSVWKIRTGLEMAGKYDETGKNRRGTGIGFGFGYIPNPNGNGFQFNFSLLDYSLISPKNGYPSETLFYVSLGYLY